MKTDNLSKIVVRMQRVVILKNVYHFFFKVFSFRIQLRNYIFFLITKHLTLFKEMDDLSMHEMKCISCNNFQALVIFAKCKFHSVYDQ